MQAYMPLACRPLYHIASSSSRGHRVVVVVYFVYKVTRCCTVVLMCCCSSANKCLLKVAQYSAQRELFEKAAEIYEQV